MLRCEKRGERPDVMGRSHFSLSLGSPAWPRGPPLSAAHKDAVKRDDVTAAALLGAKPLCSATTTKKSLCSSDSKRIGQSDGRVHLFPRGRVTVLLHKPLIQDCRIYFPPTAVIQASGRLWFFTKHSDVTNNLLTCVGCRVTAEFINSQNAYSPKKGKFEFHICGILTCFLISVSWEETKSFLELLFFRLYMWLNVALFWDLGLVRHRLSEFLFVKLFEWALQWFTMASKMSFVHRHVVPNLYDLLVFS